MLQQLKQVGMTYCTRPRAWWWAALYFVTLIPILLASWDSGHDTDAESITANLFFCVVVGLTLPILFLIEHTPWQFNHPRARLMPNFNRAHLTFAAFFLILLLIAFPLLFSWVTGVAFLPSATVSAVTVAAYSSSIWGPLIIIFLIPGAPKSEGLSWFLSTPDGSNLPALLLVLFASWAVIGRWLYSLGNRHEEQPKYGLHTYADEDKGASRTFRLAAERKRSEKDTGGRFKSWQLDRRIERVLARASTLPKWRLLRLGNRPSRIAPLQVLGVLGVMLTFMLFSEYRRDGTVGGLRIAELLHSLKSLLWLLTFLGAAVYGMNLSERLPFMVSESLLPLSKRQYLNDLLKGLAADGLWQWGIFHLAIGVLLHIPLSAEYPPPAIATCLAYLWISLACVAFTFSFVTMLSCTLRGLGGAIMVALVCAGTTGTLYGCWLAMREETGDILFLVFATGLMGIAWFFITCTRRVWAEYELGDAREE